jgi:type 1 glutamine amidotransferase
MVTSRSGARAAILVAAINCLIMAAGSESARSAPPRVLYVTHSAGFKHAVLPLTEKLLPELGRTSGAFAATVSADAAVLSPENLRNFAAVIFYTTGELPLDDAQKRGLIEFVRGGRGFVGIHSATDTFYKWPEYHDLVGGYFDNHPWHQAVTIRVEDRQHPATSHLPERFTLNDEIYQFRDWSRARVHVLLSLDVTSVDLNNSGVKRTDKDFALAWTRQFGKGRSFYTALGHEPDVWRDPRFQQHLLGGIRWAIGN